MSGRDAMPDKIEPRLAAQAAPLTLAYDPNVVSFEALEHKARELGCAIADQFGHRTFTLTGLDCADCAIKLEKAVRRLPGVPWWRRHWRALLTAAAGILLAIAFTGGQFGMEPVVVNGLYAASIVIGGYYAARSGFFSLPTLFFC